MRCAAHFSIKWTMKTDFLQLRKPTPNLYIKHHFFCVWEVRTLIPSPNCIYVCITDLEFTGASDSRTDYSQQVDPSSCLHPGLQTLYLNMFVTEANFLVVPRFEQAIIKKKCVDVTTV